MSCMMRQTLAGKVCSSRQSYIALLHGNLVTAASSRPTTVMMRPSAQIVALVGICNGAQQSMPLAYL